MLIAPTRKQLADFISALGLAGECLYGIKIDVELEAPWRLATIEWRQDRPRLSYQDTGIPMTQEVLYVEIQQVPT